VAEELGADVQASPFARVITSQHCKAFIVISPLLALKRKWCNYEFALASSRGEEIDVELLTSSGSVDRGQVPAKTLRVLARSLQGFSSADATCASKEDEALIDAAIQTMGGYSEIDKNLKTSFFAAIREAHALSCKAMADIDDHEEVSHAAAEQNFTSAFAIPGDGVAVEEAVRAGIHTLAYKKLETVTF